MQSFSLALGLQEDELGTRPVEIGRLEKSPGLVLGFGSSRFFFVFFFLGAGLSALDPKPQSGPKPPSIGTWRALTPSTAAQRGWSLSSLEGKNGPWRKQSSNHGPVFPYGSKVTKIGPQVLVHEPIYIWVWIKIKAPRIGPLVLVHVSIYQDSFFGTYLDPQLSFHDVRV